MSIIMIVDFQLIYPPNGEGSHGYIIKTEQLPDSTWKAWLEGTDTIHCAETKMEALAKILDVLLPDKDEADID